MHLKIDNPWNWTKVIKIERVNQKIMGIEIWKDYMTNDT